MDVRAYQETAQKGVLSDLQEVRSVCLVGPTGSGKTEMMAACTHPFTNVLWTSGRKDLVLQAKERLSALSNVHVCSILSSKLPSLVDFLIVDECHHMPAESWNKIQQRYPHAKVLGGTATPMRRDGAPLDMFDRMVVAAQYSELLEAGYLVPCRVFEPRVHIDSGMALDPVDAYLRYARGKKGFCFVPTVKYGEALCLRFIANGVRANLITATTPKKDREYLVRCLSSTLEHERLDILVNCTTLTEGIDVPSAEVVILARRCEHVGLYLQIVGRVLRPYPGKFFGILLDLVGAARRHGMPTDDREYSLSGTAIGRRSKLPPLRQCYICGAVMLSTERSCITCGMAFVPGVHRPPKVLNVELREVYNGSETPEVAKREEFFRVSDKPWPRVKKHYEELFGESPPYWSQLPEPAVRKEWTRVYYGLKNKLGTWKAADAASQIIKSYTGAFPPWEYRKGIQ